MGKVLGWKLLSCFYQQPHHESGLPLLTLVQPDVDVDAIGLGLAPPPDFPSGVAATPIMVLLILRSVSLYHATKLSVSR